MSVKRKLLPDELKDLWGAVERQELSVEAFTREQERLLGGYRRAWEDALRAGRSGGLQASLLTELGLYTGCSDLAEIERRCTPAVATLKKEWQATVTSDEPRSIERIYNESPTTMYELMWWHSSARRCLAAGLRNRLHMAQAARGVGATWNLGPAWGRVGSCSLATGSTSTLADISSTLLAVHVMAPWNAYLRRRMFEPAQADTLDLPHDRRALRLPRSVRTSGGCDRHGRRRAPGRPSTSSGVSRSLRPCGRSASTAMCRARGSARSISSRSRGRIGPSASSARRALGFTEVWLRRAGLGVTMVSSKGLTAALGHVDHGLVRGT